MWSQRASDARSFPPFVLHMLDAHARGQTLGAEASAYGRSIEHAYHVGRGQAPPPLPPKHDSSTMPRQRLLRAAAASSFGPSMEHVIGGPVGGLFYIKQYSPGFRSSTLDALWSACQGHGQAPPPRPAESGIAGTELRTGANATTSLDAASEAGSRGAGGDLPSGMPGSGGDTSFDAIPDAVKQTTAAAAAVAASDREAAEIIIRALDPSDLPQDVVSELQTRQLEVEMLLRLPLAGDAELREAALRVGEALRFDEGLAALAESSGSGKASMFQSMLAALPQQGASEGAANATAAKPPPAVSEADWLELTAKADRLRKLIKIKIQDDNDLRTARKGLELCEAFFGKLAAAAQVHGDGATMYGVYRALL